MSSDSNKVNLTTFAKMIFIAYETILHVVADNSSVIDSYSVLFFSRLWI